mmetsp:Transcript_130582/g.338475  ORF Transcript_130582/g.338475 Transcript_130582/m.338475 type:complete len:98 (-) Transcript_130582:83-376(-)
MKFAVIIALAFAAQSAVASEKCRSQATFDERMCNSHMCTDCVLDWCMSQCQKLQEEHPGCRCQSWAEGRDSYSGGEYQGKGKYGDVGDYSEGMSETV